MTSLERGLLLLAISVGAGGCAFDGARPASAVVATAEVRVDCEQVARSEPREGPACGEAVSSVASTCARPAFLERAGVWTDTSGAVGLAYDGCTVAFTLGAETRVSVRDWVAVDAVGYGDPAPFVRASARWAGTTLRAKSIVSRPALAEWTGEGFTMEGRALARVEADASSLARGLACARRRIPTAEEIGCRLGLFRGAVLHQPRVTEGPAPFCHSDGEPGYADPTPCDLEGRFPVQACEDARYPERAGVWTRGGRVSIVYDGCTAVMLEPTSTASRLLVEGFPIRNGRYWSADYCIFQDPPPYLRGEASFEVVRGDETLMVDSIVGRYGVGVWQEGRFWSRPSRSWDGAGPSGPLERVRDAAQLPRDARQRLCVERMTPTARRLTEALGLPPDDFVEDPYAP